MKKNENGYPACQVNYAPCLNKPRANNGENRNTGIQNRDMDCDEVPLAYVYAPMQKFCMLYSASEALKHGTLFENLYKPMGVYGRE